MPLGPGNFAPRFSLYDYKFEGVGHAREEFKSPILLLPGSTGAVSTQSWSPTKPSVSYSLGQAHPEQAEIDGQTGARAGQHRQVGQRKMRSGRRPAGLLLAKALLSVCPTLFSQQKRDLALAA